MNLTARMPSVVSSSTSSNPGKTWYGYQDPGKSVAGDDRSGKLEKPSPPGYSKEDYGQSWSSQEWKSGAAAHDRSGKPETTSWDMKQQVVPHRGEPLLDGNVHSVRYGETINDGSGKPEKVHSQEGADSENFVMGSDAAEFVSKVKDQVRSRQKRMSNVAESGEEHSIKWRMFMATTSNAATFMGKNFSTIQSVVKNHEDLTLKQMFDITSKLVSDQDEINCLDKIYWAKNSWKQLSLIGDETIINLQSTKVYVSSILCCASGGSFSIRNPTKFGRKGLKGSRPRKATEIMTVSMESRPNSSGTFFPGFTTLQLCGKVSDLLSDLGQTPETFTGRILFMSMFNDISCDRKGNKEECLANAGVVKVLARRIGIGQCSFIGPGSEKEVVFCRE